MKDKSKFKALRIAAKKRWQNRRAEAKRLKHAVEHAALIQPVEPSISCPQDQPEQVQVQMDGAAGPEKIADVKAEGERVKQMNPTEIVRANKFLGSGTFGTCHLAHYRGILVVVKEFKPRRSRSLKEVKGDVLNEA